MARTHEILECSMKTEIMIRDLVPEDASELSALFRRCYGKTYGNPLFYDVPKLAEQISKRKLISTVATMEQLIVGHMGITVRHAGSNACETGNTVVDPRARGQGLLLRLGAALHDLVQRNGYLAYLHYPTTAHEIMQKASVAYGGKETGVMLAYIPETTDSKLETEHPNNRLAVTVAYQPLSPPPGREVFLPERYRSVIESIYLNLKLERTTNTVLNRSEPSSESDEAKLTSTYSTERGLLHIFAAGEYDRLAENVSSLMNQFHPQVTHIDLPLDNPNIDSVIESLRKLGFFFSALLPEFSHTDVLRLQAVNKSKANDVEPNLVNEEAIRLNQFIQKDATFPSS